MRHELKKQGIDKLKVVYSKETPIIPFLNSSIYEESSGINRNGTKKKNIPGSCAFVPSVAGLIIAGEVIKDIIGYNTLKS